VLETLDGTAVRRWCVGGLAALKRHQGEIDRLNVYPVPDGDTGTNMVLTFTAAAQALTDGLAAAAPPRTEDHSAAPARTQDHGAAPARTQDHSAAPARTQDHGAAPARTQDHGAAPASGGGPDGADPGGAGAALRLLARGALHGARGNSGVILSQILRGLAEAVCAAQTVDGRALADGLRGATVAAYSAVARPVEGTLLSVVAAAADAAEQAASHDLRVVARAAATGAAEALARTPQQLSLLADAGVVDAGGRGLCLLLDTLVEVITGERPVRSPTVPTPPRAPLTAVRETGSPEFAYEVQFLLTADEPAVRDLRATLAALGDSLVVVGDGPTAAASTTWNVHVHVNDVGAAVEAAVAAGQPYQISVTRFADQLAPVGPVGPDQAARAAVVIATGDGVAELFAAEGAVVIPGGPTAGELLAAIRDTGAAKVVVLPDDGPGQEIAAEAAQEARSLGIKVSVVPTRSPVQALAALAVRDPGRRFDDDVIAMAEAAGACRSAALCVASREALTVAGACGPGDVLALVEGEVHLIGADLPATAIALLDRMLGGGGELVTLLVGERAPAGLGEAVHEYLRNRWPFVEVQCFVGGQPDYPLLVGVE